VLQCRVAVALETIEVCRDTGWPVLQCVAVCCTVLQCRVAVALETIEVRRDTGWPRPIGCHKLQVIFC